MSIARATNLPAIPAQMITIGNGAGLLLLPFGNWILDYVGEITLITVAVLGEGARLIPFTFIE